MVAEEEIELYAKDSFHEHEFLCALLDQYSTFPCLHYGVSLSVADQVVMKSFFIRHIAPWNKESRNLVCIILKLACLILSWRNRIITFNCLNKCVDAWWCGIYTSKWIVCRTEVASFWLQLKYCWCYLLASSIKNSGLCLVWHTKSKLCIRNMRIMSQHISIQILSSPQLAQV